MLKKQIREVYNTSLSDSGGIQTHNLLIRSQMLYSVELRNHRSLFAGAKVRSFSESAKLFRCFFLKKGDFSFSKAKISDFSSISEHT